MNVVKVSSGLAVLSNPVVQKRRSFPFCAWHKMGKFTHIVPGAKWEILEENGGEEADDGQNYGLDQILSSDIGLDIVQEQTPVSPARGNADMYRSDISYNTRNPASCMINFPLLRSTSP
jgi:hypothetical protein